MDENSDYQRPVGRMVAEPDDPATVLHRYVAGRQAPVVSRVDVDSAPGSGSSSA